MLSGSHSEVTTLCLQIKVPCDCSILWMSEAMTECPGTVTFILNQLPCGVPTWVDVPAAVAVNYDCSTGDCVSFVRVSPEE